MSICSSALSRRKQEKTEPQATFSSAQLLLHSSILTLCQGGGVTHTDRLTTKHTRTPANGWRLVLCSSVSWLSRPSLHKSQQACRHEGRGCLHKGEHRNKRLHGMQTSSGMKHSQNKPEIWLLECFQTGDKDAKSASVAALQSEESHNQPFLHRSPQNGGATRLLNSCTTHP